MPRTPQETVARIVGAPSWDARVAEIRLVSAEHGTNAWSDIYAAVAKQAYVQHLAPDFAYVYGSDFYELRTFQQAYDDAAGGTSSFTNVTEAALVATLEATPRALLAFRTMLGLGSKEFAHSTQLVAEPLGLSPISDGKVTGAERNNTPLTTAQAMILARTIRAIMDGTLFGDPPGELRTKQEKYDTADGWTTVERLAREGVPYSAFLHQRHYGGAFRQLLDATSTRRGDLLEDAVEQLFLAHGIPHIRTGAHNQAEIEARFEIAVAPAPDFVVFDNAGSLRGMLECKIANDGGTARDKALRFERLRQEAQRLGGQPLLAVLGGLGWGRVNDTLGPVIRDTEGRVFTLATIPEMLTVSPFPQLIDLVPRVTPDEDPTQETDTD